MAQSQIVDDPTTNSAVRGLLDHRYAVMRFLYSCLCLLFFAGLLAGAASAADAPTAYVALAGPGQSFSIADFDGDSKPDLASIHDGRSDSTRADYWVQLQLTGAGRQIFQINAPIGGLQIVSRDVNGDHALDLVLTTAWSREPVAVLLNDGHGIFSRVDAHAFPEALTESETNWDSHSVHAMDAVGALPQPREDVCSETKFFLHQRSGVLFLARREPRFAADPFLISHLGRAPPSKFLS
jgi:hypothetical protein